jgi:antitoxin component YwqK of YwqJK toxin-antitoxin module
MGTDIMGQRGPGQNKWLVIGICLGCLACNGPSDTQGIYLEFKNPGLRTKRGITYHGTTPFSGVVFSLNERGDTIFVIPYSEGKENGFARHYYNSGKLKSLRYSRNGWKEGEHTAWFENGLKQFQYHFKNDMFEGNQKEWLPDGSLYSDLNYEKGMESGHQRVWYANGKIKTNYIIKNNRRYGLLGTKNCVNIPDSVFAKR